MSALPPLVDNWNVINCIYADGPMAFCIFPAVAGGAKKRFQVNSQVNKTPILLKPRTPQQLFGYVGRNRYAQAQSHGGKRVCQRQVRARFGRRLPGAQTGT